MMTTHGQENLHKNFYEKAKAVMPGGVNSPVRSFSQVESTPIFARKAIGSKLWDEEGHCYIDLIGGFGPHILGHSNPIVSAGVMDLLSEGITFGLSTALEIEMAETLTTLMPSLDMVRMVNSGTEATMSAIRLARGFTKRKLILKFEGCYHGHSDSLLIKAGSGGLSFNVPTSEGVLEEFIKHTIVGQINDSEGLMAIWDKYGKEIAAVIVEPIPANMGVVPLDIEFLKLLRTLTTQTESLLIFDEVISGFRIGLGGAQDYYKIQPDLTCLGKIIGGGMPVGAYGGRRDIMSHVSPLGGVYQAGTLSGNKVALRMGLNTLQYLMTHQEIYSELEAKAKYLEQGMLRNLQEAGVSGQVNRVGSLLSLFFTNEKVINYETVMKSNTHRFSQYFSQMLAGGVLMAPSTFEALFLSTAHTYEELDLILAVQKKSLPR